MKPSLITDPAHECEAADTISATLDLYGLDVTITAFDRSPDSLARVERLAKAIDALFSLPEFRP